MQIAIFNPGRNWEQMAWAIVSNDTEAHDIGILNGFFSWKLESLNEYKDSAFCKQVKELK